MTVEELRRLGLQGRIALSRAGLLLPVAILMIVVGAACWAWVGLHDSEQQRTQALIDAQQRLPPVRAPNARQERPLQNSLKDFYEHLGKRADAEQYVATMFRLAKELERQPGEPAAIALDQGEYRWQVDNNSKTYRYQILFPVKASYASIRRYCENVLQALPFAALDELSFKRESVGDEDLDATLRFSLFLKDESAGIAEAGAKLQ